MLIIFKSLCSCSFYLEKSISHYNEQPNHFFPLANNGNFQNLRLNSGSQT